MDTKAYLYSHGWLGAGHALNASSTRQGGISQPIHIPQKQNLLGVGKKKHDSHADQWWARAFDRVLKNVNDPTSVQKENEVQAKEGPVERPQAFGSWAGEKRWGLYGNFVRGEGLEGTLRESVTFSEKVGGLKAENETERMLNTESRPRKKRRKEESGDDSNHSIMQSSSDQKVSAREDRIGGRKRESKEERRLQREERKACRKARREARSAQCRHDSIAQRSIKEDVRDIALVSGKERQEEGESYAKVGALRTDTIISREVIKKEKNKENRKRKKRRGIDGG